MKVLESGDLVLEVVDRFFYCRYCSSWEECYKTGHRAGIWFLTKVTNTENKKTCYLVFGTGETEETVPWNIEPTWETRGGWLSYDKIYYLEKEEEKDIELTPAEAKTFYELLISQAFRIIRTLYIEDIVSINHNWGIFEKWKPLVIVWVKGDYIILPLGANIHRIGRSFKAEFQWDKIKFRIPKMGRKNYDIYYYQWRFNSFIHKVRVGYTKKIYYTQVYNRKILYYVEQDSLNSDEYAITGYELYNDAMHQPIRFRCNKSDALIDIFINYRLGDLLFVNEEIERKLGNIKLYNLRLEPATKREFRKVKVIRGCLCYDDSEIFSSTGNIVLYHPEHGLLELPTGKYKILRLTHPMSHHD